MSQSRQNHIVAADCDLYRALAITHSNQVFNLNNVVGGVSWWNRWHFKIGMNDLRLICLAATCIHFRYNNCFQLFVMTAKVTDFLKEVNIDPNSSENC